MKKNLFNLTAIHLLLIFTAMSCGADDLLTEPTTLKNVIPLHFNNEQKLPVIAKPARVKKEAYILGIHLECEKVEFTHFDAYELLNGISFITIYTENDFNENYPAGSVINECFKIYPLTPQNEEYGEAISSTKGINIMYQYKGVIYNALKTMPDPGEHIFRIVVTLQDGEEIERITEPIELY